MAGEFEKQPETADMLQHLFLMQEQELNDSCRILCDLLLANSAALGISQQPDAKYRLLVTYADSLAADRQHQRALHYYKSALAVWPSSKHVHDPKVFPSGADVKWSMYKTFLVLKDYQEAFDILSSVPVNQRSVRIVLALARLYLYHKSDAKSAMAYYRLALMQCPFAVEAALALLKMGLSHSQLQSLLKHHTCSMVTVNWLAEWTRAQESLAKHDFADAVKQFNGLSQQGFVFSPETNSQVARSMSKLGRQAEAIELFTMARSQDHYVLSHMDTFSRILASKSMATELEQLSNALLSVSTVHCEPWVARLWFFMAKKCPEMANQSLIVSIIHKVANIPSVLSPKIPELSFVEGTLLTNTKCIDMGLCHFSEAVRADPSFFEANEFLIRCYLVCRGYKTAYSAMKLAIQNIKVPAQQLYLEAIVLSQKTESIAKAQACLEKAITMDRTFEKAPLALSKIYQKQNQHRKAVEMLSEVLEYTRSISLHAELGACLYALDCHAQAMEQLEIVLRLDPNHERAASIMQKLLHGERERGGGKRMGVQRRSEEDQDHNEEENMVEGLDDVLTEHFRGGPDQQVVLQQQLHHAYPGMQDFHAMFS